MVRQFGENFGNLEQAELDDYNAHCKYLTTKLSLCQFKYEAICGPRAL